MKTNMPENVLYGVPPTFSLLLASHGGLEHRAHFIEGCARRREKVRALYSFVSGQHELCFWPT